MGWNHDPSAIHWSHADEFKNAAEKSTPIGDDEILLEDSEDSKKKKRAKLSSLPGGASALDDLSDVDTSGVQDGDALVYDSGTWVPGGGGGGSYSETIGDGSNSSYQVTHGLGTEDLVVQLWDLTGSDPVEATGDADSITVDDEDNITVAFSAPPATDSYRVVVLSDGGTSSGGGGGGVFEGVAKAVGVETYSVPGLTLTTKGSASVGTSRFYVPVVWAETIHVDSLVAEVTGSTGAGRALRVGLYESDFYQQPQRLIAEGEIDASTTGVKTVSVDRDVPPGRYLLCFQSNHGSVTYRFHRVAPSGHVLLGTNNWPRPSVATTYGALPDPGVAWDTFDSTSNQFFTAVYLQVSEPA